MMTVLDLVDQASRMPGSCGAGAGCRERISGALEHYEIAGLQQ
jgi:hypothetical protein